MVEIQHTFESDIESLISQPRLCLVVSDSIFMPAILSR